MAKQRKEWFAAFFDGLYGRVLAGMQGTDKTLREARLVKRLLRLRRGQAVLDCPCGMGRLSIPLAKMGLKVTGVDLSKEYVKKARRLARQAGADAAFTRGDMREIDFDGEFHAVVNWFTSFGYFSDADSLAFCRRVYRALRPGGRFLIEVLNKSNVRDHWAGGNTEVVNGVRVTTRPTMNWRESTITDRWTVSRGKDTRDRRLSLRLFNGTELRGMLTKAGFRDIRLLAHAAGKTARFTRHSRRLIIIGRKDKGV